MLSWFRCIALQQCDNAVSPAHTNPSPGVVDSKVWTQALFCLEVIIKLNIFRDLLSVGTDNS